MSKICVIGAGASGIIASLKLSKNNEVILIDKNNKIGKKILLTGNGKCNYFNSDITLKNYNTDNVDKLDKIIKHKHETLAYLDDLGIYPRVKNGYYYPNSLQASSIVSIFNSAIEKSNIKVLLECEVLDIIKNNDFVVKTTTGDIVCDKVVVACGGCSYPKTGSNGSIFNILSKYHTINELKPSLVPLKSDFKYLKEWDNLRVDAKVNLYIDDDLIDTEIGEVQLTDYGISGIPIFNLSGKVARFSDRNIELNIDFLNDIDDLYTFLDNRNKNNTIEELFETILPYQLVNTLLDEIGVDKKLLWNDLDNGVKNRIIGVMKEFNLNITGTLDFDRSQVTSGGVSLEEINPDTMESLKVKDLYLIGEVLDVDGKCGGFNLAFSFISGYVAGSALCIE